MTRILFATAASLLAMTMAATGQDQTKLVFAYWGDPAELPPFEKIVADYEAANPGIDIEVQHAPWSGYFTRLDAQLAAGAGPDVFFITNVPTYAARNQLEPLDRWIADNSFPIEQYNQEALAIHSLDGKLYSIPRDNDTNALYYNRAAFDAAGVAYPEAGWDWDDLREAALALTQRDGSRVSMYGFATEANDWPRWIIQNGGDVFDNPLKPTHFTMDQPAATEAVQFLGDLINTDRVMPSFQELQQSGGTSQLFLSGQVAMVVTNAARLGTFADAGFDWAAAPLPTGRTGIHANRLGGAGFAMNAFSQNKDAAWDFLSYLAGEPGQVTFASANASAVPAMVGNDAVRAAFNAPYADVFLTESENGKLFPQFVGYVDITNLYIQPALDLVWTGESNAQDAISAIAADVAARLPR